MRENARQRLPMLDGWRAISILAVLAGHMLPLGPAAWGMNGAIAANGMAVFFTLSGFLIVNILRHDQNIVRFLARRLARIMPLAWTVLIVFLSVAGASRQAWSASLLFYANLPPFPLIPGTWHFWSLCVEMQFYAAIAATVLLLGRRGLWLVPLAAAAITAARIATGMEVSVVTWLRADEILAGGTLALIVGEPQAPRLVRAIGRLPFWPVVALTLLSARSEIPALAYARPYLTATMVGITIVRPVRGLAPLLLSRGAAYLASISYAVYIIHPFTILGWLGSGHGLIKYAKRPLCFVIAFAFAHLSTFRFELPINRFVHRVTGSRPAHPKLLNGEPLASQ